MLSLTLCSVAALSATLFAGTPSTNAYAGETVSHDLYAKTQLTLSLDVDNKYYDGEELKPKYEAIDPTTKKTVTVEDASLSYVKVADADGKSVEPEKPLDGAPKDAGTYRVTYTVTDTDNYLGGSVSQDVRIYRALPNPESPALEPIKFREGLKASEEPFPAQPEDGTWSWTRRVANQEIKDPDDSSSDNSSDDSKDSPDVVTALAMFTPKDTNNYAVVYRYLKFEVYKDKPAGRKRLKLSITAANKTYDGQPYSDSLVTTTAVDAETGEPVEVKGSFKYYPVKKNNDRDDPWWSIPSSAGGHEVVWKVESTDGYLGGEVSTRFLIEQAPAPTISVNDATGTWRGSEPKYTYTVSGLVPADEGKDVLAEGTKAELDRGVTGDKGYKDLDAGVYVSAITVKNPQLIKNASGYCSNYKDGIFVKAGTLTVAPVTPTTTVTAKNKTYDGAPAEVTCSVTDPTSGEKLDSAYSLTYYRKKDGKLAQLDGAPVDAGSYTVVMNVPARTNYSACEARREFTIAKAAAPTITVKDASGTWRGSEPKYAYTVSGLVDADKDKNVLAEGTKAELDQHITGDKGYKDLDAGVYTSAITVKNPQLNKDAGSNYENGITVKAGTLTIAPVTPTATVTAKNKTYDGAPAEVTCSVTDPTSGEKLDSAYSLTYYRKKDGKLAQLDGAPVDAGSYTVVMNVPARTNYNACEARCEFTISKAPAPTITANDVTVTWRDAEPAYTYTVSGLVPADKDKNVLAKGTKAELDRGVTGDKGYQGLDAGVYASAITVKDPQLNKDAGANYENAITVIAGTLTVSPLTPKAAVDAAGKTYDGTPAEVTCSVIDPTSGEKLDSSYSLTYYRNSDGKPEALDGAPVDAGSYTVVMNVPAQTNYSACEARCDFTIAKAAAPTITVKDASVVFGEPEPAYSFKVNGLVGGDKAEDVIAQGTTAALDSKLDYGALDAGEHKDAITVANPQLSEKGAVNYKSNIKVVAGTLTIEPANVTGTIAVEDKTYDGKPVEPAVEIANAAGKKVDASHEVNYYLLDGKERTEDLGAAAPKNAGSYEAVLRVTDTVNYRADEASCTFTIGKAAAPTITVEDATGTWRGSEPKYVVTVEGLADGETADSVIQSTAAALDFQKISQDTGSDVTSYADLAVGTYADAITVANAQLTDAGKVNYQSGITVIPGTLTVEVTQLTLKLDVASKTYDGAPVTATWSVVDPVTGNALNDLGTLTYYEIVNGVPTKLKEAPTNAGTYLAELSANVPASYTAEPITASFSIYRATPNPDTPQLNDLELRDGLAFADVTIPNDPNGSWSWADGTCAITEAGTESGLAVYTPVDTQNFSRTTCVLSFNVVDGTEPSPEPTPGKPKPTLTIEVTSKVYDGAPASITTEVHDSATSTTEVRNSVTRAALTADGTLTYFEVTDDNFTKLDAAPVNAGHYAVLFEVAETDEYAASSVTTIFDIYRAVPEPQATPHPDPTHPDPALPDLPLTSALKLGDLQLPADDEGTWAWVAPETALTATGTCRFLACYTPNDARNYASVFGWWTFNVVDAAEPDPEPTPSPTPNPTDPGNTKTTKTVTTTTSTTSKIPNTGDRTLAIVASLGIAGGIIVAAALMFIKRRA